MMAYFVATFPYEHTCFTRAIMQSWHIMLMSSFSEEGTKEPKHRRSAAHLIASSLHLVHLIVVSTSVISPKECIEQPHDFLWLDCFSHTCKTCRPDRKLEPLASLQIFAQIQHHSVKRA